MSMRSGCRTWAAKICGGCTWHFFKPLPTPSPDVPPRLRLMSRLGGTSYASSAWSPGSWLAWRKTSMLYVLEGEHRPWMSCWLPCLSFQAHLLCSLLSTPESGHPLLPPPPNTCRVVGNRGLPRDALVFRPACLLCRSDLTFRPVLP
jgi:hypothetical protein